MSEDRTLRVHAPKGSHLYWDCPGCETTHGVPIDGLRGWQWDAAKKTLAPSVLVNGNAQHMIHGVHRCHCFIRAGKIAFLNDCTHALAGQFAPFLELDRIVWEDEP